jgi:isoamylase
VHQFVPEQGLVSRGLTNYWGYNTIGFLAPHNRYSSAGQLGEQVGEFKTMVKTLHDAGIEVILDVVYNHTAEGNHLGPTLAFRGIDNASYYRLADHDKSQYVDYTGCGNSLNVRHPHSLQLIMDSLRYWVIEMHVDGFRFDLASALARELHDVDRLSTFFDLVQQDPVVSQVKLIAEPWDVGEGGYQVGNFPPLWTEWNGQYRDVVRDLWRGQPGTLPEFASRLSGSSDLYETSGRRPVASINFVTCHDGFPLRDLVSYNHKHNDANGEDNRDGTDDNRSWNCGAEGPTADPEIDDLRDRQKRNFLTTLFFSQGVPMLLAGDELGRTQGGNNNAYCQDNEVSWVDWSLAGESQDLIDFTRTLSMLRREHPVFRRRRFFRGRLATETADSPGDIVWLTPQGREVTVSYWREDGAKALAVFLNGDAISEPDPRGERITDDRFLLLFNAGGDTVTFTLPEARYGASWQVYIDTCGPRIPLLQAELPSLAAKAQLKVTGQSVIVLCSPAERTVVRRP